jgi:hypothetical protein
LAAELRQEAAGGVEDLHAVVRPVDRVEVAGARVDRHSGRTVDLVVVPPELAGSGPAAGELGEVVARRVEFLDPARIRDVDVSVGRVHGDRRRVDELTVALPVGAER